MAQFISDYKLKRDIGTRSEYSNLGVGLLGHALAMRTGTSYEALLRKRICDPLGMANTVITLDSAQAARMAQGHDADGDPAPNWDLPTLAGAGAIRSSVSDLLKFLAANLAPQKTPLAAAIAASHEVQFRDPKRADDLAFAWQVRRDEHLIWHNGQTGAFHAFAGFDTEKRLGVVLLANTASRRVDELGFRLVKLLTTGEAEPLTLASAIHLEPDALQPFVGTYQLGPLVMAAIAREGDQLFIQLTGQQRFKIHPVSSTRFVCRVVDAAVIFESDPEGAITRLVLDQNGLKLPAPRKK
jgi:CubicO group peptidase (beta-lactamase class C family)